MTYVKRLPDKAKIKEFTVGIDHFWLVPSASAPLRAYKVRRPEQKFTCECPDYQNRHAGYSTECKHGQAVRELLNEAMVAYP